MAGNTTRKGDSGKDPWGARRDHHIGRVRTCGYLNRARPGSERIVRSLRCGHVRKGAAAPAPPRRPSPPRALQCDSLGTRAWCMLARIVGMTRFGRWRGGNAGACASVARRGCGDLCLFNTLAGLGRLCAGRPVRAGLGSGQEPVEHQVPVDQVYGRAQDEGRVQFLRDLRRLDRADRRRDHQGRARFGRYAGRSQERAHALPVLRDLQVPRSDGSRAPDPRDDRRPARQAPRDPDGALHLRPARRRGAARGTGDGDAAERRPDLGRLGRADLDRRRRTSGWRRTSPSSRTRSAASRSCPRRR